MMPYLCKSLRTHEMPERDTHDSAYFSKVILSMILNHMRCLNEDAIGCLIFARPPSANEPYNACLTRPARQDTMDLGMSLLANQPLIIGLICRKKPVNIRHPMGSASPCFKTARMQGERR